MKKTLLFFFDALRPDYITKHNTPFLYWLKETHTYVPLKSLLGYSMGIHPSIWTGTWQESHGKFLVYQYAPEETNFGWYPYFSWMPMKLRSWLIAGLKIPYYFLPAFRKYLPQWYRENILELPPTIDPKLAPNFALDHTPFKGHNLLDDIEKQYTIRYLADHKNGFFEEQAPLEEWQLSEADIDFFFTYDTDAVGHNPGPRSDAMKRLLRRVDAAASRLYQEAKQRYGDVNVFVWSDHGMCEVKYFCDVQKYLDELPYTMPEDYIAFFDASMVRFWTDKPQVKKDLIKCMKQIPEITYLDGKKRKQYHVDFEDRRFGDILCTVAPETRIYPDYFAPVKAGIKGLHGYDPDFEHSKGIFLSNCMTTKKKEIRIVDILPTVMEVLGLPAPKKIPGKSIVDAKSAGRKSSTRRA